MDTQHWLAEESRFLYRYYDGWKRLPCLIIYYMISSNLFILLCREQAIFFVIIYCIMYVMASNLHLALSDSVLQSNSVVYLSAVGWGVGGGVMTSGLCKWATTTCSDRNREATTGKKLIYVDGIRLPVFLRNCVKNTQTHTISKLYQEKLLPSARFWEALGCHSVAGIP